MAGAFVFQAALGLSLRRCPSGDACGDGFGYNTSLLLLLGPRRCNVLLLSNHRANAMETNPIHNLIKDLAERTDVLRGYL